MPENPTWQDDWEIKDIEKWKDIIQAHSDDIRLMQAGSTHLMRYERPAFGLLDALNTRDDPAAYAQGLGEVQEAMSRWIAHRQGKDTGRGALSGGNDAATQEPNIDVASFHRDGEPVTWEQVSSLNGFPVGWIHSVTQKHVSVTGHATATVSTYPKGYRYVGHDLFEAFHGIDPMNIHCPDWRLDDGTDGGAVCYAHTAGNPKSPVVVGWLHDSPDEGSITVVIRYEDRDKGRLPGQVIEEYLRQYPSDLPENPTWLYDWEIRNMGKWIEIMKVWRKSLVATESLRSSLLARKDGGHGAEEWKDVRARSWENHKMIDIVTSQLRRYHDNSLDFSLELYMTEGGATGSIKAIDTILPRMKQWIEEHKNATAANPRGR